MPREPSKGRVPYRDGSALALEPEAEAPNDARISAASDIGPLAGAASRAREGRAIELTPGERELFHGLYRDHFDFVFRNLRRLGVAPAAIDDALQDVFLVALRRISDYQKGTYEKAWLFAIAMRVAGNHRRSQRRQGEPVKLVEERLEAAVPGPFDLAAREEARRLLHEFLESLEEHRRAVFVLAELEQLSAPEIAAALPANLNTVYSWLRVTRAAFVRFLERRGLASRSPRG